MKGLYWILLFGFLVLEVSCGEMDVNVAKEKSPSNPSPERGVQTAPVEGSGPGGVNPPATSIPSAASIPSTSGSGPGGVNPPATSIPSAASIPSTSGSGPGGVNPLATSIPSAASIPSTSGSGPGGVNPLATSIPSAASIPSTSGSGNGSNTIGTSTQGGYARLTADLTSVPVWVSYLFSPVLDPDAYTIEFLPKDNTGGQVVTCYLQLKGERRSNMLGAPGLLDDEFHIKIRDRYNQIRKNPFVSSLISKQYGSNTYEELVEGCYDGEYTLYTKDTIPSYLWDKTYFFMSTSTVLDQLLAKSREIIYAQSPVATVLGKVAHLKESIMVGVKVDPGKPSLEFKECTSAYNPDSAYVPLLP